MEKKTRCCSSCRRPLKECNKARCPTKQQAKAGKVDKQSEVELEEQARKKRKINQKRLNDDMQW
jgi:hypothetical protein